MKVVFKGVLVMAVWITVFYVVAFLHESAHASIYTQYGYSPDIRMLPLPHTHMGMTHRNLTFQEFDRMMDLNLQNEIVGDNNAGIIFTLMLLGSIWVWKIL